MHPTVYYPLVSTLRLPASRYQDAAQHLPPQTGEGDTPVGGRIVAYLTKAGLVARTDDDGIALDIPSPTSPPAVTAPVALDGPGWRAPLIRFADCLDGQLVVTRHDPDCGPVVVVGAAIISEGPCAPVVSAPIWVERDHQPGIDAETQAVTVQPGGRVCYWGTDGPITVTHMHGAPSPYTTLHDRIRLVYHGPDDGCWNAPRIRQLATQAELTPVSELVLPDGWMTVEVDAYWCSCRGRRHRDWIRWGVAGDEREIWDRDGIATGIATLQYNPALVDAADVEVSLEVFERWFNCDGEAWAVTSPATGPTPTINYRPVRLTQ